MQAELPSTPPRRVTPIFASSGVKQRTARESEAPPQSRPYFRKRPIMPIPPDNATPEQIEAVGMHRALGGHMHSPGIVACPNGDLIASYFSVIASDREFLPSMVFTMSRLCFGADEWDWPEYFPKFHDIIEGGVVLFNNDGVLWHIAGGVSLYGVPFQWHESRDNGATWSETRFPRIVGPVGPYDPHPVHVPFRGTDGTLYLPSDGHKGSSLLWATRDNGKTWYDTGGRTHGRHTAFAPLKDGRLLGMGGKSTNIDGYMPKSVSSDSGKTWEKLKTPFSPGAFNQRPSLHRLKSGRLFFACDAQPNRGVSPMRERGVVVALSDDEGETWHIKSLAAAQIHDAYLHGRDMSEEGGWHSPPVHREATIGYSEVTQSPDGIIHLITSCNHPCLHFEMNEAWILDTQNQSETVLPVTSSPVQDWVESHPGDYPRVTCSEARNELGQAVLHGLETWNYDDGSRHYEAHYENGVKVGSETCWDPDGRVRWTKARDEHGDMTWSQYWPNRRIKAESRWHGNVASGPARLWSEDGTLISEVTFENGNT